VVLEDDLKDALDGRHLSFALALLWLFALEKCIGFFKDTSITDRTVIQFFL
jgi:hypothetical protein